MTIKKAVASLKALAAVDGIPISDNGSFEAILSAPTLDRDGDLFETAEWKTPLPEHIVIDIDHEMSVAGTVGSATPFIDDDGNLRVRGSFASTQRAQEVRTLVNEGHIRTMSVACLCEKSDDGTVLRELLNGAIVAVPSNRESVILSSKALDVMESKAAAAKDTDSGGSSEPSAPRHDDMVQAVHDAAVALGADCVVVPDDDPDDGSSEGANKSLKSFVVGKALSGSVEDLRDRLDTALTQTYAGMDNGWPCIRATFLDGDGATGTIIYDLDGSDNGDVTLAREFTDDGETVTLADEFTPVELVTSVKPTGPTVDTSIDPDQDGDNDSAGDESAMMTFVRGLDDALTKSSVTDDGVRDDSLPDGSNVVGPADPADPAVKAASAGDAAPSIDDESADADLEVAALAAQMRAALTLSRLEN